MILDTMHPCPWRAFTETRQDGIDKSCKNNIIMERFPLCKGVRPHTQIAPRSTLTEGWFSSRTRPIGLLISASTIWRVNFTALSSCDADTVNGELGCPGGGAGRFLSASAAFFACGFLEFAGFFKAAARRAAAFAASCASAACLCNEAASSREEWRRTGVEERQGSERSGNAGAVNAEERAQAWSADRAASADAVAMKDVP